MHISHLSLCDWMTCFSSIDFQCEMIDAKCEMINVLLS